jgi:hypothetical protein
MNASRISHKIIIPIFIVVMMQFTIVVQAEEVDFPVSAYMPQELEKVREWEKTWTGKKVDISNIDQVAEFLPRNYVEAFKDPEKWNAPEGGNFFYIGAYEKVNPLPGEIEATKKYAPLVKTDDNGVILNYAEIAGVPFPQPKTGLEVAYNMDCNSRGDTFHYRQKSPSINPRTKTDRFSDQEYWRYWYIHRCSLDPKPAVPKNSKGYHHAYLMHMYQPPEMLNTRMMTMRHIEHGKEDKQYLYYAQFRRIRRLSTTERENNIDGADIIYDDGNMWDGHIGRNTYKLIGKKEFLVSRHQDMKKVTRQTGQGIADGLTRERCNLYEVEVKNINPDYIYSKRTWYIDPETNYIVWQEIWDKLGRYWKCYELVTADMPTELGQTKSIFVSYMNLDLQRNHAGMSVINVKGLATEKVKTNLYTLSNLQKTY